MTASPDELLVGVLCLAIILPWAAWTLRRGLVQGRLPIGRGHVLRDEQPGRFKFLLTLYALALVLIAFAGLDLLFGFTS